MRVKQIPTIDGGAGYGRRWGMDKKTEGKYHLWRRLWMSKSDDARLLGVKTDVGQEELRSAFRSQAIKFHPDMAGEEHADRFIRIREAFERLREGHWDRTDSPASPQREQQRSSRNSGRGVRGTRAPRSDFMDIVAGAFNGLGQDEPGRVVGQVEIEVPLDFFLFGARIEILYPVYTLCKRCNGEGFLANSTGLVERCSSCRGEGERERELRVPVVIGAGSRAGDRLKVPLGIAEMPGNLLEVVLALDNA